MSRNPQRQPFPKLWRAYVMRVINPIVLDDQLTTKLYVDDAISAAMVGLDWQESVLDRFDPTVALPVTPSVGDRYISTATANGWTDKYIYECVTINTWTGAIETIPNEGFACTVEDEDAVYYFNNAGAWVKFGSIINHANLSNVTADQHHNEDTFARQIDVYYQSDSRGNDGAGYDGSEFKPYKTVAKVITVMGSYAEVICDSSKATPEAITIPTGKTLSLKGLTNPLTTDAPSFDVTLGGNGANLKADGVVINSLDCGGFTSTIELGFVKWVATSNENANQIFILNGAVLTGAVVAAIQPLDSRGFGLEQTGSEIRPTCFNQLTMNSKVIRGLAPPSGLSDAVDLQTLNDKFSITTGHDHDGTDSKKVAHPDLVTVGASDHHAKYTDAEAVTAMGAKADANPLHHDKGIEAGTSFPGTPSDGDIFNRTDLDMVFRYDATRVKWLSEHSEMLSCGRGPVSDVVDAYCGVANAPMSSTSGFRMPRNGTIIAVTVENQNVVTRTIDCRVNNSLVNRVQVVLTAVKGGKVVNANQDFSADDLLQVLALIAAGNTMTNLITMIEVKWRA